MISVYPAAEVQDGAGVRLKRYIGNKHIDHIDPFLLLDEFKSENPEDYIKGFPPHPHKGFQTLTYMIEGRFKHKDSTGCESEISSGQIQWMNAGKGIIHSEMPLMKKGKLWGFQIWLNSPSKFKNSNPFYFNYNAKVEKEEKHIKITNLIGKPFLENQYYPVKLLHIFLKGNIEYILEKNKDEKSFIIVSEGSIEIDKKVINDSNLIKFNENIKIKALKDTHLLFASAEPLNEPIARMGPFVMNTKQQLIKAFEDYKNGKFA